MKFKLGDCGFWVLIICIILGVVVIACVNGQEKEQQLGKVLAIEGLNYPAWKIPIYMQENLQWMLNDFNKRFDTKVNAYKKELKTRFKEFKNMPDDVVLYLEGGIFIKRSDFQKMQGQLRGKLNKQRQKREVKENDKTTD